jgi:hypothetical protein
MTQSPRYRLPPAPQWFGAILAECRTAMSSPEWRDVPVPPLSELYPQRRKKSRGQSKPTLANVTKQASKAGIAVVRYEIKPDGSIVVITDAGEPFTALNPWPLDDFKATKQ